MRDPDLSVTQHDMLVAIGISEGLSEQHLAEKLLVVKSILTALLARLERRGPIRREPAAPNETCLLNACGVTLG